MSLNRSSSSLTVATLRDAAALSMTGVLAKAMGLIVTVLVARFHGPEGLGTFALLLSVTLLLEQASRFGVPELSIRAAGARPDLAGSHWRSGLRAVFVTAALPTVGLVLTAMLATRLAENRYALLLMAAGMPLAAVAGVGQSVLQARGRAVYVTSVSFAARAASLIALVALLSAGMGIIAAFIARVVFEGIMALCFAVSLRALPVVHAAVQCRRRVLQRALPFAIGRILTEANLRTPLLWVSSVFAMSQVGIFDSADRVGLAFQAMAGAGVVALIPVFSRSAEAGDPRSSTLIGYSLKYTSLFVSAGAYVLAAFAGPIMVALYGPGFAKAADVLPLLLLAQSLTSADAVMRQALFAHGREYAIIGTGSVALAIKVALIAALSSLLGLPGAALGVLLSAAATFAIDLWLAQRAGLSLDAGRFVVRPVLCVVAAFVALEVSSARWPVLAFLVGLVAFLIAAAILRVFPNEERRFVLKVLKLDRRTHAGSDEEQ